MQISSLETTNQSILVLGAGELGLQVIRNLARKVIDSEGSSIFFWQHLHGEQLRNI